MKLFTKGLLLIAIPSLVELALVAALAESQNQAWQAERRSFEGKQVIFTASSILSPMLEQSSRLRTAVLGGDADAVAPDPAVFQDLEDRVTALRAMVKDSPLQVQRLDEIISIIEQFRAIQVRIADQLGAGNRGTVLGWYRAPNRPDSINRLRKQLSAFLSTEQALDDRRSASLARVRAIERRAFIAAVLGSILSVGAAAWFLTLKTGRRLSVLSANTERLARGRPLFKPIPGTDEIARLDEVLHDTAVRLRRAELEESRFQTRLAERAVELADANEHLRRQTQDNEMFIYSVSHDLRSPLVNLQGFSRELELSCNELRNFIESLESTSLPSIDQQAAVDLIDGEVAESLRFLNTAVMRATSIIESLLRLSRAGRIEYRWQQLDTRAIVTRVIESMATTVRSKQADIKVGPMRGACGDANAVDQIFANLIGNALAYLDPGRPGCIEIGEADQSEYGLVEPLAPGDPSSMRTYYVRDNGLGIAASYIPKMFTAFQRFHGEAAAGEGVGLALVRRMVERHGGRIWVTSVDGRGSTFYVALPVVAPTAQSSSKAAPRPAGELLLPA
jgi:signal transduction histidine kinase